MLVILSTASTLLSSEVISRFGFSVLCPWKRPAHSGAEIHKQLQFKDRSLKNSIYLLWILHLHQEDNSLTRRSVSITTMSGGQPVVDPSRYQGAVNTTVLFITKRTTLQEGVSSSLQSLKSPSYKDSSRYQGAFKAQLSKTQGGYTFLQTPFINIINHS